MIDAAEHRKLCLSFRGSAETFPFGAKTSVFKVAGKMFASPSSPSTAPRWRSVSSPSAICGLNRGDWI
jgi:predicted DNA-binding protein (MmcQ/YjbR family)